MMKRYRISNEKRNIAEIKFDNDMICVNLLSSCSLPNYCSELIYPIWTH